MGAAGRWKTHGNQRRESGNEDEEGLEEHLGSARPTVTHA
jgi:hypothetical protein